MMDQDRHIAEAVERESGRLRGFIRRRVPDERDVEDILQEVFFELVETYRLMKPVEQVGAWLFQVARNRIVDLFRRRRSRPALDGASAATSRDTAVDAARSSSDATAIADQGGPAFLLENLPAPDAGPEADYVRGVLLDEIEAALEELPAKQREAFVAHEIDGQSFKEMSAATGVGVNTLLARKHQAVLYLRRRLGAIHAELGLGATAKDTRKESGDI